MVTSPAVTADAVLVELFKQGRVWLGSSIANEGELLSAIGSSAHGPNIASVPFGIKEIDGVLPGGGLVHGSLHEWMTALFPRKVRRNELLPPFSILAVLASGALSGKGEEFVVWVGKASWPSPYLLQQTGLLSRSLFINPPDRKLLLWSVETALRSPAVKAVVAACPALRFAASRRLALAAAKGGGVALLTRDLKERDTSSAAASRWLIEPEQTEGLLPRWRLTLLKNKGPQTHRRHWVVEMSGGKLIAVPDANPQAAHEPRRLAGT